MSISTRETLQDILASAKNFYDVADFSQPPPDDFVDEVPTNMPPPLSLDRITAELESKMINAGMLPQLRQLTLQRASDVVSVYEASYRKACQHLLRTLTSKSEAMSSIDLLRSTLEYTYKHKNAVDFYANASAGHMSLKRVSPHPPKRADQQSKPFNHAFTPFLEAYLEQNAFPSMADQRVMAEKSGMSNAQIVNWFQNHRSRTRKDGREADLKRLPPGKSVNVELIEEKIKLLNGSDEDDTKTELPDDGFVVAEKTFTDVSFNLDELACSSTASVPKTYSPLSVQPYVFDNEAFGLPTQKSSRPSSFGAPQVTDKDLHDMFDDIDIRRGASSLATTSKVTIAHKQNPLVSKESSAKTPKTKPFKAALRSCFSAAMTLTCPRAHPALIPHKKKRASSSSSIMPSTVLEQKRLPMLPYTLPTVLPSWELPTTSTPGPIRRKKPTIPSHGSKMRPGSPYPKQTISRMSSASSLTSMSSDDSQLSSRSSSSTFSESTMESSEPSTPAQSPGPDNAELIDDVRFTDDMFGHYLFYSNPMPDNFFFDINVEEPFDKDVSLSVAEFDKSVSLSIAEFETTTLPSFDFFES